MGGGQGGNFVSGVADGATVGLASGKPSLNAWKEGLANTYTLGSYGANKDAKQAAKDLENSLLKPIKNETPLPTVNDAAVQAARNSKLLALQSQSGRASTFLSGTQGTKTTFGS